MKLGKGQIASRHANDAAFVRKLADLKPVKQAG
jgi:hypothetical protein